MSKFTSCFILLMSLYAATAAAQQPRPTPEMQKLLSAQLGRWSQREERADGSSGQGEAVWQPGPGRMSLVENEYVRSSTGEMVGLSVTWWDEAVKGYRALWCSNRTQNGCLVMSKPAHWEGDQFVLGDEFERDGKKLVYKEVESQITPNTYTLTSYIGEPGGELKSTSTIHATRITEDSTESPATAELELRAAMAERLKASLEGDSDKVATMLADDYLQTDISGHAQDKATWFKEYFNPVAELIKAGKFRWEIYEQKDLQFRIHCDSAVVIGVLEAKGKGARWTPQSHTWEADLNASFSGTLRFTHVYVKRNGKWLLAALHNAVPFSPPETTATMRVAAGPAENDGTQVENHR